MLLAVLERAGYRVKDFGTHSKDSCDYPLIGFEVARAVSEGLFDAASLSARRGVGMGDHRE